MKQNLPARLALCALLFFAVSVFAQAPQPFSADYSTTSPSGNANMKGKFYFSLPKMRIDMSDIGSHGGPFSGPVSMIVDGDAKTAYMLMSQQHMYMEFPTDNNPMMQRIPKMKDLNGDPCSTQEGATCKKLGTEAINGRTCDKWEMTQKEGKKETLWIDQKIHFPIKTQSSDGMTSEFTNIQEGAQAASLFKVPDGYQKMDLGSMGGKRPH